MIPYFERSRGEEGRQYETFIIISLTDDAEAAEANTMD